MATSIDRHQPLVGRDDEVQTLLDAYRQSVDLTSNVKYANKPASPSGLLVLIRGHSGTGKTALASSLRKVVQQDDGYFLSGKFDLASKLATPYAVFVSAMTQFIDQLLETTSHDEERLSKVRRAIQEALGSEGKLLVEIIPALQRIIRIPQDEDDSERQLDNSKRFQYIFCRLCMSISAVAPIVIFLDDLQWGDSASLELLLAILQSRASLDGKSSLLVVGAYRDEGNRDNVSSSSNQEGMSLMHLLNELKPLSAQLNLTNIQLGNLSEKAIHKLTADVLNIPSNSNTDIGAAVFSVCKGNPLHTLQLLENLRSQSPDESNGKPGCTQWNDSRIVEATHWKGTIEEIFRRRFLSLADNSKSVLQVAACLGDEIDESAIVMALDLDLVDVISGLQMASADGHCVFNGNRGRYYFSHDRSRQAVLSTIDSVSLLSFQIGRNLWTKSSPLFLSTHKFLVAQLLNCATEQMTDQAERYSAAALNLEAGIEAASKAHFPESSKFLAAGIELLKGSGDSWKERYDLSLSLYNAAVDTEVFLQNFGQVDVFVMEIMKHATSLQDKLVAYIAAINSFGQRGLIPEAIAVGIDVMDQLGDPLPQSATKAAVIWEVVKTKYALRGKSNDDLLRLHLMNDDKQLAAMHVLSILLPYVYQAGNFYSPILGTRLIRMCLKFGIHKNCAYAFIHYAMLLCLHDRKEGHRLGSLALAIVERWRAKAVLPRVHVGFYSLIHHWRYPLHSTVAPLQHAIQLALEAGDVEVAMFGSYYACSSLLHSGSNLGQVETKLLEATQQMRMLKQEIMQKCATILLRCVQNLTGSSTDPLSAAFSCDDEPVAVRVTYFVWAANLAFRFGDYELAYSLAQQADRFHFKPFAQFGFSVRLQTDALTAAALARLGRMSPRKARKICKSVWKKMKSWEADCPENFFCKRSMVEAELKSLKHRHSQRESDKILSLYNAAVQDAVDHGFIQEAALASELAGDYLQTRGIDAKSKEYWEQAYRFYIKWGGMHKAAHLAAKTGVSTT